MTQWGWWQRERAILSHVPAFIPPYLKKGPERASPANQFSSPRPSDGGAMMRISLLKCLSISLRKVRPYPACPHAQPAHHLQNKRRGRWRGGKKIFDHIQQQVRISPLVLLHLHTAINPFTLSLALIKLNLVAMFISYSYLFFYLEDATLAFLRMSSSLPILYQLRKTLYSWKM